MKKKWLIRSLMGAGLIAEVYLLLHFPPLLLVLFMIGKSDCSLKNTLAVEDWSVRYRDAAKRTEHLSRMIAASNGLQLWSTPRGEFWMPESSVPLESGVLAEQELMVYGSGPTGVQPGDVVIDCGADIGTFTRLALEMGASLVIAVEPAREKEPCLQRNFTREIADGRVRIYPKGVWNKVETLPFYRDSVHKNGAPPTENIHLTTIDNLVSELKLERIDFIKMDIEGAEKQALEGASQTLVRFRPRLAISTEHSLADAKDIPRTIRALEPAYRTVCGPCTYGDGRISPHVLYFH